MNSRTAEPTASLSLRWIATALGWLCVFATLALLSPGVVLTASGEEAPEAGPSCSAGAPSEEASLVEAGHMLDELRARAAAEPPAAGDGDTVVLNNRGYFYGPPADPPEPEAPTR